MREDRKNICEDVKIYSLEDLSIIDINVFKQAKNNNSTDIDKSYNTKKKKRVLLRLDWNIPVKKEKNKVKISDFTRIDRSIETIEYLVFMKYQIVIISHIGNNIIFADLITEINEYLDQKFNLKINLIDIDESLNVKNDLNSFLLYCKKISNILDECSEQLYMIENIRLFSGEEKNDDDYAKIITEEISDLYVNDAFSVCHRKHMSINAINKYSSFSCAGFSLIDELFYLKKYILYSNNLNVILGGKKISTKLPLINELISKAKSILLGGGILNVVLKKMNLNISYSFYEMTDEIMKSIQNLDVEVLQKHSFSFNEGAKAINQTNSENKKCKIFIPYDFVIRFKKNDKVKIVQINDLNEIYDDFEILDVGQNSIRSFSEYLVLLCKNEFSYPYGDLINSVLEKKINCTVLWNGPIGYAEDPRFQNGSIQLAKTLVQISHDFNKNSLDQIQYNSSNNLNIVIGGGDTIASIPKDLLSEFSYVCTGGGAFIEWLINRDNLIGIKSLKDFYEKYSS